MPQLRLSIRLVLWTSLILAACAPAPSTPRQAVPLASPTGMPAYVRSHPALIHLTPLADTYSLNAAWTDTGTIDVMTSSVTVGCDCLDNWLETHLVYTLTAAAQPLASQVYTQTVHRPPPPPLPATLLHTAPFQAAITMYAYAPDQRQVFILAPIDRPGSASPLGGEPTQPLPENWSYQAGWVVNLDGSQARQLFTTGREYTYRWTPDSQYLLVEARCYGLNLGQGLYAFNAQSGAAYPLQPDYPGVCEGSQPLQIAPDSQHVLFDFPDGQLAAWDDRPPVSLCPAGPARSYAWSTDGRYAYAACSANGQTDALWRYDTHTAAREQLTDPAQITFKAAALVISPDQKRAAFLWGDGNFFNQEPYGLWILDLSQAPAPANP